jgi:O-antigen ligase
VSLTTLPAIRARQASPLAGAAAAGGVAGIVVAIGPAPGALAGAIGLWAMLAIALASREAAIALGFLLFGVVRVEPAPADAVLALVAGLAIATGQVDLRRVPGAIVALLAALVALNVVSLSGTEDLPSALRFMAITLYLVVLAVWLASHLRTRDRMRVVIRAYVAGAVVTSALAVAALFVAYPGHELLGSDRAQGFSKDPNVFAPFLIPAALIAFEETLRPRLLGVRRPVAALLFAVLVLGIVFAYSRAAWLNLAVALAAMLLVLSLRAGAARAAVTALAVVAVVAGFAGAAVALTGSGAFLQERARLQTYDTERFSAQASGVELGLGHAFGIGPGQFDRVQVVSAHSLYVRVLAEQGVLGLATLTALLAGTLLLAIRNALDGRDAHGVGSAVLLGAWCGLLANSAFIDTLHWRHLWLVAALIWCARSRAAIADHPDPPARQHAAPESRRFRVADSGSASMTGSASLRATGAGDALR